MADYDGAMRAELKKLLAPGEELPENPWEAEPHWEARMDLVKRQPGFWRGLKKIQVGFFVFELIGTLGFQRVILTKGPVNTTSAWTEKAQWRNEFLPGTPLFIVEDKGLVYGKVLYDDWPKYILRWLEWRPRGRVLMRDTPYNQGFEHPQVMRLPHRLSERPSHVDELRHRIESFLGGL